MPVLEKDEEQRAVDWAIHEGWLAPKVHMSEAGWPDRVFVGYGVTIWIEFKRWETETEPDPLQRFRLKNISTRGVPAYWVDNAIDAIRILETFMESKTLYGGWRKNPDQSIVWGPIARSGIGKDIDRVGRDEDLEKERLREQISSRRATPTVLLDMASGNKQVGGLCRADLYDSARQPRKRKSGEPKKRR